MGVLVGGSVPEYCHHENLPWIALQCKLVEEATLRSSNLISIAVTYRRETFTPLGKVPRGDSAKLTAVFAGDLSEDYCVRQTDTAMLLQTVGRQHLIFSVLP